jgi:hypothetical protein
MIYEMTLELYSLLDDFSINAAIEKTAELKRRKVG